MTIGVVIAVRDQARYLGEALDSLAAQTLTPARVIVVDDGSSDGTGEVARLRGIETLCAPGVGPSAARTIGAGRMDTDLLAFLDGDDRFTPDHHATLKAALSGAPAAAGATRHFYDLGREAELAARYALPERSAPGRILGAMLFDRSAFTAAGGFPIDPSESDLIRLLGRLGAIPMIDHVVLERRIHGANRSIVQRAGVHSGYLRSAREAILARRATAGDGGDSG